MPWLAVSIDSCIFNCEIFKFTRAQILSLLMGRQTQLHSGHSGSLMGNFFSPFEVSKNSLINGCEFHVLACKTFSVVGLSLQNTKCQNKSCRMSMPKIKRKNRDKKKCYNLYFKSKKKMIVLNWNAITFKSLFFFCTNAIVFFTVLSVSSFHSLQSLIHSTHQLSFWSSTLIVSFLSS